MRMVLFARWDGLIEEEVLWGARIALQAGQEDGEIVKCL